MKMKFFISLLLLCVASHAVAQYRDYSRMGKTPAELRFIEDPHEVDLKEPSWFWHSPKKDSSEEQLRYADELYREGDISEAAEAYDDLVHEWHASVEALRAQLMLAQIYDQAGKVHAAYEEYIYLLAYFAGRFELEPVLTSLLRLADAMVYENEQSTLGKYSNTRLRSNYEHIIHYAPRWKEVPAILLRIAKLYASDENYSSTLTICDRIVVQWSSYEAMEEVVDLYCSSCRSLAYQWRNDVAQLLKVERLLAGAIKYASNHPKKATYEQWVKEIYTMRRDRSYAKALFYDNPAAYPVASTILAYEQFLADFPDAKEAGQARERLEVLRASIEAK
jgi:hypothetical protein